MMAGSRKYRRGLMLATGLIAALLVAVPTARATQPNPGVLPPEGRHYGRTYGEWGAAY